MVKYHIPLTGNLNITQYVILENVLRKTDYEPGIKYVMAFILFN